jgi:hypothetical protein
MTARLSISLKFIDFSQNREHYRNKYLYLRPHFDVCWSLRPRLSASPPDTAEAGVFYSIALNPIKGVVSRSFFLWSFEITRAEMRRKVFSMTDNPSTPPQAAVLDCERYRAYIAPLGLSREQEDELLRDLWAITEALVEQSFASSPTYPQQFANAANAFGALDRAVAVESNRQTNPKADNDNQTSSPEHKEAL